MRTAFSMMSFAAEMVASVVAPPRCAACDSRVLPLAAFCPACASTVEAVQGSDTRSVAAFGYGGAIARAITRLKYSRRPDLARPLGDLLWRALRPHAPALHDAIVVPVPLHPSRLAERGFNQSALIARRVARRLDTPLLTLILARIRDTPQQAALDRAARIANVAGAFRVRQPERVRRKTVLLVDDVRTTGATLDACTCAMMSAGATSVTHAVVARVGPDDTWVAPGSDDARKGPSVHGGV
jgi:ComF family protein